MMRIVKIRKKWVIEGDGKGWIFNKRFPTKWKATIALDVFKKGGRVSDYWKAAREYPRKERIPWRVLKNLQLALEEIKKLNPTAQEIEEYGKNGVYGVVTYTKDRGYFPPRLHNTWGKKSGGRVHIDIGSGGVHLMLDKSVVWDFIEFTKTRRKLNK
jgi:hypothetical protein